MASSSVNHRPGMAVGDGPPTRIMIAVNQSSINGYPQPSISSGGAFECILKKIVRSNVSGFKLLFLHVEEPHGYGFTDIDRIYTSPRDFSNMMHSETLRGLHLLEYFVNRCFQIGVSCEAWIKTGDPSQTICYELLRVKPDFLVVGSRGLGIHTKILAGSVSDFCRENAGCPMIVIKRQIVPIPVEPAQD